MPIQNSTIIHWDGGVISHDLMLHLFSFAYQNGNVFGFYDILCNTLANVVAFSPIENFPLHKYIKTKSVFFFNELC